MCLTLESEIIFQKICKFCGIRANFIFFKVWPIKTFQLYVLPKYKASEFNKKRHDLYTLFYFNWWHLRLNTLRYKRLVNSKKRKQLPQKIYAVEWLFLLDPKRVDAYDPDQHVEIGYWLIWVLRTHDRE